MILGAPCARLNKDFGAPCHKNRFTSRQINRLQVPSNGLTASRDKILAALACYSHTSDWQISLRLLETINPSGADSDRF